ncbi:MAG: YlbF family regulator [Clostridia bacterium]|nr:YlbF family regulator [Clostridia bacterium]
MNFYDKIHALVRDLKDTPEYTNYMAIKERVKADTELSGKIKRFRERQRTEQLKQINGVQLDEATKNELQQEYSLIIQSPLAVEFFQAEIKLDVLLADMQKILGEGLKDVIEF